MNKLESVKSSLQNAIDEIDEFEERFKDLEEKEKWLECLEAAGVDNWEGMNYAGDLWREVMSDEY